MSSSLFQSTTSSQISYFNKWATSLKNKVLARVFPSCNAVLKVQYMYSIYSRVRLIGAFYVLRQTYEIIAYYENSASNN